ncbi:Pkinase-domain-containing protein [Neoconidiobolus thromboides FSU 785]|nr:Pkinase-domain-containing protein [Neoconidiobolus thromboides FSU 785]
MDFLDPVDIDPRYPGRRQSKLLYQVIQSQNGSQSSNPNSRLSVYKNSQADAIKLNHRQTVYKTSMDPPSPDSRQSIYRTVADGTKINSHGGIRTMVEGSRESSRQSVYRTVMPEGSKASSRQSVYKTTLPESHKSTSGRSRSKTCTPGDVSSTSPIRSKTLFNEALLSRKSYHQPSSEKLSTSPKTRPAHLISNSDKSHSRKSKYQTAVSPEVSTSPPISIPGKITTDEGDILVLSSKSPKGSPESIYSKEESQGDFKNDILDNSDDKGSTPDDLFGDSNIKEKKDVDIDTPTSLLTEVGDYLIKRDIGQGTFGVVKLAEHKVTKLTVAIKVITKASIKNARARARVEQELRLLPLLDHPNIVKVYEVIEDEERYMIVMEHISGGELFQYIVKNRRVNERESRYFFRQIVSALQYCHHNSIIHRDMKPENLLLDSKMQIKLIDFGFASFYHPEGTLSTFCGSPYYASPEMVRGLDYVGPEVDIWSLGVTLYTMLSGKLPFNAYNLKSFQRKVTRGEYEIPVYFSKEVTDLIRCTLNTDRRKRISIDNIRLHPWTNAGYSDLPSGHLMIRPPIVRNPDIEIMKLLDPYGYKLEEVKLVLLTNNRAINPVYCLYHLLEESKSRREKEKAKVEKQRQKSLKRTQTLKIDTSVAGEHKVMEEERSPDQEENELISTEKSRRYSIDTTHDDNFSEDLPLSQTPLKAAGRSFDSISRRQHDQSKIRPVIANNIGVNNSDGVSQSGLRNPLLIEKEPKEGWFTGLFNVSTTSNKPHQQIVQELERVMTNLQIEFQQLESRFVCESKENKLAFEVRIMWKDSVKAFMICFKNLKGSSWAHKKFCYKIIQRMFI